MHHFGLVLHRQTNDVDLECKDCHSALLTCKKGLECEWNLKIHSYSGQSMENVNQWWKVTKLSDFANISVTKPVNFGSFKKNRLMIQSLLNPASMKLNIEDENSNENSDESKKNQNQEQRLPFDIRYLLCAGPPLDLGSLLKALSQKNKAKDKSNDKSNDQSNDKTDEKTDEQQNTSVLKLDKQKPSQCERAIIGIAVFDGQDMIVGYLVKQRVCYPCTKDNKS